MTTRTMRLSLVPRVLAAIPLLFAVGGLRPALGAVAEIPTAGLATASMFVGGVGAGGSLVGGGGGGWGSFFLGALSVGTIVLDPDPAVFYEGRLVISYPDDLLAPTAVGWFGNFAANPGLPYPPVSTTPFWDSGGATYDLWQAPNPSLNVSMNAANGVLTLDFNAPGGVYGNASGPFNFVNIQFQNISGQLLEWAAATQSRTANVFQNPEQQTMLCIPDPNYSTPVTVGHNGQVFSYEVTIVPEPGAAWLLLFGGLLGSLRLRTGARRAD